VRPAVFSSPESPFVEAVTDPRLPSSDTCVLRYVLDRQARERPSQTFVCFEDGSEWSYADLLARVRRTAAALQELGVAQGEHVVVWLPNGPEALRVFMALGYMGAVYVPINTGYRGPLLAHVLANSGASLLVADSRLLSRLDDISAPGIQTVVATGPAGSETTRETVALTDLEAKAGELADLERPIRPWDTQSIIYTSGTTGPSKGALSTYVHAFSSMDRRAWPCVRDDDRFLINLPMFHIGGSFITNAMLCRGGSIAMVESFRTEAFWDTVRRTESTAVFLLGVMGTFLMKRPPGAGDRDHPLRMAFLVPLSEDGLAFSRRFGVEVFTLFNMTEIATPLLSEANPSKLGACGRLRKGVEARLVDDNDCEVETGSVGELILRMDDPWTLSHGYNQDPAATARAWRNGWFHTGDAFRRDSDGNYEFVDRLKDVIRRRGENVSSFEVEAVVNLHPDVQESAAIPVPSEHGEDDVMIVVAPRPGCTINPAALAAFLTPRMAHFMVPRYIRVLDALPKTPTAKVQKAVLREAGRTVDTWDREAAGLVLKRERLPT
jgi:crotonobetaine/carnitine-CoA ligase